MWRLCSTSRILLRTRIAWKESSSSSFPRISSWPRLFATHPAPPKHEKKDDDDDIKKKEPSITNKSSSFSSFSILPGLGLSAAVATAGFTAAASLSTATGVPLSGIPVSILLGMTLKNSVMGNAVLPDATFQPGLQTASKTILQTGIVCVAAKLSVGTVLATSASSVPVVVGAVGTGLWLMPRLGAWAGLPVQMSLLLTAGTSICGVTAITALAPAIQAPPRDIAVAVANTVAFGTIGMLVYPYVFHALCESSVPVGMCLGVAIHDTSQVLGAALSYKETFHDETAFQVAAVTKLLRNLGLAVAIPALTYSYHKTAQQEQESEERTSGSDGTATPPPPLKDAAASPTRRSTISGLPTFSRYVPPFLYAFLAMSAFRSIGDLYLVDVANSSNIVGGYYTTCMDFIGNDLSKYALGTAMAAVGLSTSTESLRGVGYKPFLVGGIGALAVGGTGFAVATMVV